MKTASILVALATGAALPGAHRRKHAASNARAEAARPAEAVEAWLSAVVGVGSSSSSSVGGATRISGVGFGFGLESLVHQGVYTQRG